MHQPTGEHRTALRGLVLLLVVGAAVRLLFFVAWRPAFMGWPDAKSYIDVANGALFSSNLRPAGYPLFLRGLDLVWPDISFVVAVNHLLGLATAAVLYLAVVRAGGPRLLGLVPAAIVALGGDGMFLEHSPLSEPLFTFLVAVGLYAAVRTIDGPRAPLWAAAAGLAISCSATVRVVGVALLPVMGVWALAFSHGRFRRRALNVAAGAVAAAAVFVPYYVAEYAAEGEVGLSRSGNYHLYGRVAPFADCSKFTPPAGTEVLCETTKRADRPIVDAYIFNWWFSPAVRHYGYAFEVGPWARERLAEFAWTVIWHQPLDYLEEVGAGMLRYVAPGSLQGYGGGPTYDDLVGGPILFNPVFQWQGLVSVGEFYGWRKPGFESDPGMVAALRGYESVTRVQGPLMVLLALFSFSGPFLLRGRPRAAAALFTLVAWTILTVPVATLEFSARTAVPGFGALGCAAAVGGWGCIAWARARRWTPPRPGWRTRAS